MKSILNRTVYLLILMLLFQGTQAQFFKSLDKQTLLTIGDEKIPVHEFLRVYEKNNTAEEQQKPDALKEYLDLYINFKLKVMEAEALKMDTISSFKKELSGYRKQLAKPYFTDQTINEKLLKEAYDRMQYEIRASHILVMVDKNASPEDTLKAWNKINKIRQEIMDGKKFSDAADEYSDDPSAKDMKEIPGKQAFRPGNHGDLGYFTVFNMVYPFETAAYNTPVGEVSQPVRTQYGYHLVKVTDKKPAMGVAEVAHIFVRLRPNASEDDVNRKTEKINKIYEKLQDSLSWDDAVKQYSEDKGSVSKGGRLSKFTCNRIVPEFVKAIDSLKPGEYSKPVRTMYGWHIIKLIGTKKPGTFEEEKAGIEERLKKDARSQLSQEAVISKIKKDYGLKIMDDSKSEIFAAIDTTVLTQNFKADSLPSTLNKPILKLGKVTKTQHDFAKYVEKVQKKQVNIDKNVYLNQLFNQFINNTCLEVKDKNLEKEYPEFANLMQEYHDGILLFNLSDKKVWSKAVQDTTGLNAFFEQNRVNYQWKPRAEATVYSITNKKDVDKALKVIKNYDDDGKIAETLLKDSISSVKIIPGKFERGDNKYVDKVEWKSGFYKASTSDVEDLTVFVKIKKIIKPQAKTLEEARGLVTADYQTYLEKEWVKELRQKYPVKVNEKVFNKLIEQEENKNNK